MGKLLCRIYNPFRITRACSKAAGQTLQGLEQANASQITRVLCICLPGDPSHRAKQSSPGKSSLLPVLVFRKATAVTDHSLSFGSPFPGLCSVSGRDKAGRTNLPRKMSWLHSQLHSLGQVTHLPLVQETEQVWSEGLPLPQEFGGVGRSWGMAGETLQTPLWESCPGPPREVFPHHPQRRTTANWKANCPEPLAPNFGLTSHPSKKQT